MPYAKSIRSGKKLNGVRPDPGLLFDCKFLTQLEVTQLTFLF
jgi:hypothetical protein